MFIRTKTGRGKRWNYLVESYRDKSTGRPLQRIRAYLGQHNTVAARRAFLKGQLRKLRWKRSMAEHKLRELDELLSIGAAGRLPLQRKAYAEKIAKLEPQILSAESAIERLERFM